MSRPSHHANASRTLFQNPWKTPDEPDDNASVTSESVTDTQAQGSSTWLNNLSGSLLSLPSSLLSNIPLEWAQDLSVYGISPTKVVKPDFNKVVENEGSVKVTWLGHASFLVELPLQKSSEKPIRVLFDPMFSDRAGPSAWTGIRRRLPPPCTIAELPEFHFVVTSHNHYDHLDLLSIQEIMRTRDDHVTFLVPLGVKSWFLSLGISDSRVFELDWWGEIDLPCPSVEKRSDPNNEIILAAPSLTFVSVPAQHTSGRNVLDKCATLWCGWVVKQKTEHSDVTIYHAGDTGYIGTNSACPVFREIGERCGPIDFAMLPIWRGGTLSFISQMGFRLTHHPLLSAMHASPADAVAIHRDVGSAHTLAMHFGTFAGSESEELEPLVELSRAREAAGLDDWWKEGGIGAVDVGETVEIPVERRNRNAIA